MFTILKTTSGFERLERKITCVICEEKNPHEMSLFVPCIPQINKRWRKGRLYGIKNLHLITLVGHDLFRSCIHYLFSIPLMHAKI